MRKGKIMTQAFRAIEVQATVADGRRILLDDPLPDPSPSRVRVIILLADESEIDERAWLRAASENHVFGFLNDPAEDLYTLADGKPFHDEA